MIEERYEDLLNREVDGETTPAESVLVKEHLSTNPAARDYYEDLVGLQGMLRAVEAIEAPAAFKEELIRLIRTQGVEAVPARREKWLDSTLLVLKRRLTWGTAYAFAAGVAMGVALLVVLGDRLIPSSRFDTSTLPGAMLPIDRFDALEPVDSQPFQLQGIQGIVQTKRLPSAVLADIELASEHRVEILVAFEGASNTPLGFAQREPGEGQVTLGSTEVRIDHVGKNRYLLAFGVQDNGPELRVQVRRGDSSVERVLRTQPGER